MNDRYWRAQDTAKLNEKGHYVDASELVPTVSEFLTLPFIDGKSVTVDAKIGEEGQLFGSVTPAQIADAIQAQLGLEVDRKRVGRGNNIKTSGKHAVEVNLYREITATVNVLVGVTEEEPAAEAAEAEADEAAEEVSEESAE